MKSRLSKNNTISQNQHVFFQCNEKKLLWILLGNIFYDRGQSRYFVKHFHILILINKLFLNLQKASFSFKMKIPFAWQHPRIDPFVFVRH